MNILYFLEASVTLCLNTGWGRHLRQHLKDRTTNRSIEKMYRHNYKSREATVTSFKLVVLSKQTVKKPAKYPILQPDHCWTFVWSFFCAVCKYSAQNVSAESARGRGKYGWRPLTMKTMVTRGRRTPPWRCRLFGNVPRFNVLICWGNE